MTGAELLRIGSRGSALALWQANHIAQLLEGRGYRVEIEVIKTTGDRLQEVTFAQVGTKGMFTLEIEDALRAGRIDLAVHSLKDLPTELPEGFVLAATPNRADARDVFVSAKYARLADLPEGARVGTSSLRRRALLKAMRPDLECIEFRGNVDTRLRKLGEGQAEAILLAGAGVDRLNKTEWVRERLAPEAMCPAPGQGALGIEARAGDGRVLEALAFLDDAATRFAVTAERAALAALGGGCQVPIGVYCRRTPPSQKLDGGHPGLQSYTLPDPTSQRRDVGHPGSEGGYELMGAVGDPEGERVMRSRCEGSAADGPEALGRMLAEDLKRQGAAELIAAVVAH